MSHAQQQDGAASLRARTHEEIYEILLTAGPLTSTNVLELTGLPASTVRHAIRRLTQDGRIEATGVEDKGPGSGSGRPSRYYRATAKSGLRGAIDFGQSHITVAVSAGDAEPIAEQRVRFDVRSDSRAAINASVDLLTDLTARQGAGALTSVVAGVPAPIDRRTGVANTLLRGQGWSGVNASDELSRRLETPVTVDNDAALGAYGELTRGIGRGHRDILYLKASRGVGAALVLDGRLYRGAYGIAGEIAHNEVANAGSDICQCGRRGCLGPLVSVETIRRHLAQNRPDVNAETAALSTLEDDPSVRELLEEVGRTLGRAVASFCNLINPSLVIVGGELGASGSAFIAGVQESIIRYGRPATVEGLQVKPALLGVRASIVGALQMSAALA